MDGPRLPRPPPPARGRAARRGPAARLRRADPRPAPGRRVVGRLVGQPQLGARPAAVRARRRRQRPAGGPRDADRRGRDRALRGARGGGARMHQRRAGDARPADRVGRASRKQPAELSAARFDRDLDWRWRRTSYSDITAGSYEARVASEPEENVVDDEEPREGPAAPAPDEAQPSLLHERAVAAGGHAGRRARRHLRAPRLRGDRLRRPRPRRRARHARRRRARAPARRRRRPAGGGRRPARGDRDAARPAARRQGAQRHRARRSPRRADLRDAARRRRPAHRPADAGRHRRRPARAPHERRPARRLRRPPRGPDPAPEPARLPDREHRPRGAQPTTATPSPTTRRTGSRPRARS